MALMVSYKEAERCPHAASRGQYDHAPNDALLPMVERLRARLDERARYALAMARRLMFVQLKSGHDTDRGPCWIAWVDFNRSWKTAQFHDRELRRFQGPDANFYDVDTKEWFWLSGPKRDRSDTRYGPELPTIDADAREAYTAFLDGAPLPGREQG